MLSSRELSPSSVPPTENPSFEVIRPLLSRCQTYVLQPLDKDDLLLLLRRALTADAVLGQRTIELRDTDAMLRYSGGDARKLLNTLELVADSNPSDPLVITDELVTRCLQQNPLAYDKDGEMHYDIISAFIKSIRGSDPDAAVYWLARMVEGGEDPAFIARRLVISAAEDIGLANPQRPAAGQRLLRCRDETGLARRAHTAGRSHHLPCGQPPRATRPTWP